MPWFTAVFLPCVASLTTLLAIPSCSCILLLSMFGGTSVVIKLWRRRAIKQCKTVQKLKERVFFFAEKEPKRRARTPTSELMLLLLDQNILNGKLLCRWTSYLDYFLNQNIDLTWCMASMSTQSLFQCVSNVFFQINSPNSALLFVSGSKFSILWLCLVSTKICLLPLFIALYSFNLPSEDLDCSLLCLNLSWR